MVQKRKDHFYEGWLYHLLVDPALRRMRRMIRAQVESGSTLIDIGCGTGELLFSLADLCSELVGIETSYRMWAYSSKRARAFRPVRILHGDGARLEDFSNGHFDYATACMVLHEMEENHRLPVLREMKRVARTLILVDYRVPPPVNIQASLCRLIERLAGKTHYGNYASFARAGGLPFLLKAVDLTIQKEISLQRECFCLVKTHLNDT
jgi:SAM-dependent methyltransferase